MEVLDIAGKEFTETFYSEILSQMAGRSSDAVLVDFAVALQRQLWNFVRNGRLHTFGLPSFYTAIGYISLT